MKISNKYVAALIQGGIATVLASVCYAIASVAFSSLVQSVFLWLVVGVAIRGGGAVLAAQLWCKIDKATLKKPVASLIAFVGAFIHTALAMMVSLGAPGIVVGFAIMYVIALLILRYGVNHNAANVGVQGNAATDGAFVNMANVGQPATGFVGMANQIPHDQIANGDGLSAAILNAVRGCLKAPLTAVLCGREQMVITESNGVYTIEGVVHSQNGFGAMIATDFRVTAYCNNGYWVITSCEVGKKAATAYAKSFAKNYAIISICVVALGLVGTFFLFFIFGLF